MFSAAGASLFLTFLPMLPSQILLNNLLYDTSQLAIPTDEVDPEQVAKPTRWDVGFIRRFMLFFGPISSVFDFITFGVMLWAFHAGPALFRSGWFVESLATQTLVIFAIRTRRVPFFRSRPSLPLMLAALAVVTVGTVLPFTASPPPGLPAAARTVLPVPDRGDHQLSGPDRGRQALVLPPLPAPGHVRAPAPDPGPPRAPPRCPLHHPHPAATPPAKAAAPTRRRECSACFRCLMVCARGGSRSSTSR
jgi:hypothetical protein